MTMLNHLLVFGIIATAAPLLIITATTATASHYRWNLSAPSARSWTSLATTARSHWGGGSTTSSTIRQRRRRRRNNTGFFYGLRDDDINNEVITLIAASSSSLLSPSPSCLLKEEYDSINNDDGEKNEEEAWMMMPTTYSTSAMTKPRPRLLSNQEQQQQQQQQALSMPTEQQLTITVKQQSQSPLIKRNEKNDIMSTLAASTKKRRRRRKNNTGFYYGIREDIFNLNTLPPSNTQSSSSSSSSTTFQPPSTSLPRVQSSITAVPSPQMKIIEEEDNIPSTKYTNDEERGGGGGGLEAFPFLASSSSATSSSLDNTNIIIDPKDENSVKDSNNSLRILSETLTYELRTMKEEITALRDELRLLGGQSSLSSSSSASSLSKEESGKNNDEIKLDQSSTSSSRQAILLKQQRKKERKRQLEQLGPEVERWAKELLTSSSLSSEDNNNYYNNVNNNVAGVVGGTKDVDEGWKEITCNSFVRNKFNKLGKTRVYLKWMPDSRTSNEDDDAAIVSREEKERQLDSSSGSTSSSSSSSLIYPCIRCHATIDAPLDQVCSFLSNPNTIPMYNELIDDHRDIEIITPSSKVTWCKVPKILFVKPRDFVTYCSHRWLRDGTQVIINQAIDHEDVPGVLIEGSGSGDTVCRGYALRGANFISRDPSDPSNKTCITMISHANPGGGLPQWAMTTAINAVVQVEPFKFFHNMNESICNYQEPASSSMSSSSSSAAALSQGHRMTKNVGIQSERSTKPAGIAHLGFTCFWPNGGGLKEEESGVLRNIYEPIQTTPITAEVEAEAERHGV